MAKAKVKKKLANPVNRTGKMIRRYREDNDLTQLELAQQPGLNYGYANFIGMLESGNSKFPLKHWKAYAKAIEADESEFLVAALLDNFPDMEPCLKPLLKKKK